MAYQEYAIGSLSDAISRMVDFCTPLGFVVNSNDTSVQIRTKAGGKVFTVSTRAGNNNYLDVKSAVSSDGLSTSLSAPLLGIPERDGTTSRTKAVWQVPTRMFAISSSEDGHPFVAFVIEFGFNRVRHLYIGEMNAAGNYGGGEVVDVVTRSLETIVWTAAAVSWTSPAFIKSLFGTRFETNINGLAYNQRGGVFIEGMGRGPLMRFAGLASPANNWSIRQWLEDTADKGGVFGGFGDGINDAYVACGLNRLGGITALIPINLYVPERQATGAQYRPIGHPAGVRMLNLEDSNPYETFTVGSQTWHSFPMLRRSQYTTMNNSGAQVAGNIAGYPTEESSAYMGYAYRSE